MNSKKLKKVFSIILTLLLLLSVLPTGAYVYADKTADTVSAEEAQVNDDHVLEEPVEEEPFVELEDATDAAEETPPVEEVPTDAEQPAEMPDEPSTEPEVSGEETSDELIPSDSEETEAETEPAEEVTEELTELAEESTENSEKLDIKKKTTVNAFAASDPDVEPVSSWEPTNLEEVKKNAATDYWQVVSGNYFGESRLEETNIDGVTVKKDVIASKIENLFYVALKVKVPVSWSDIFKETQIVLRPNQNLNKPGTPLLTERPSHDDYITVTIKFYVNENETLEKQYYAEGEYNNGQHWVYWENPYLEGTHKLSDKGKIKDTYEIKMDEFITENSQVEDDVIAMNVVDPLGEELAFDSTKKMIYTTSGTEAKYDSENRTINWAIHPDGTIKDGEFDEFVVETDGEDKKTFYREYDLLYSVHLDASSKDFVSGQAYYLNDTEKAATLTYKDSSSEQPKSLPFLIPSVKGALYALTFTKQEEKEDSQEEENSQEDATLLEGATFTLNGNYGVTEYLAKEDISYYDAYKFEKTSGTDGKIIFENLPWGTYKLTETEAPAGYDLTFKPMDYALSYTTTNTDYQYLAGDEGVITNKRWAKSELTIKKVVDNPEDIILASDKSMEFPILLDGYNKKDLQVYDADDKLLTEDEIKFALSADEEKTFYIRMKEVEPIDITEQCAEGSHFEYVSISQKNTSAEVFTSLEISEESETGATISLNPGVNTEVIITNHYIPQVASVSLHKVDIKGKSLAGAEFDLYTTFSEDPDATEETLIYKDTTYYKLADYTTGDTGIVDFENLDTIGNAKYLVVETKAPAGYYALKEKIEFHFDKDNQAVVDNVSEDFDLDESKNIEVINREIYNLPGSGGRGTAVFTTIGSTILMGVLLLVVIDKQRKSAR